MLLRGYRAIEITKQPISFSTLGRPMCALPILVFQRVLKYVGSLTLDLFSLLLIFCLACLPSLHEFFLAVLQQSRPCPPRFRFCFSF